MEFEVGRCVSCSAVYNISHAYCEEIRRSRKTARLFLQKTIGCCESPDFVWIYDSMRGVEIPEGFHGSETCRKTAIFYVVDLDEPVDKRIDRIDSVIVAIDE